MMKIVWQLSFHHRKIIQIGKGGMILTNDDKLNDY